jgi:hypothetical protein
LQLSSSSLLDSADDLFSFSDLLHCNDDDGDSFDGDLFPGADDVFDDDGSLFFFNDDNRFFDDDAGDGFSSAGGFAPSTSDSPKSSFVFVLVICIWPLTIDRRTAIDRGEKFVLWFAFISWMAAARRCSIANAPVVDKTACAAAPVCAAAVDFFDEAS